MPRLAVPSRFDGLVRGRPGRCRTPRYRPAVGSTGARCAAARPEAARRWRACTRRRPRDIGASGDRPRPRGRIDTRRPAARRASCRDGRQNQQNRPSAKARRPCPSALGSAWDRRRGWLRTGRGPPRRRVGLASLGGRRMPCRRPRCRGRPSLWSRKGCGLRLDVRVCSEFGPTAIEVRCAQARAFAHGRAETQLVGSAFAANRFARARVRPRSAGYRAGRVLRACEWRSPNGRPLGVGGLVRSAGRSAREGVARRRSPTGWRARYLGALASLAVDTFCNA